jgi:predicted HicB family RNase H-like nuclease
MIHKGYEGVLEVDEESGELFGTVKGLRDVVTFVGATVEEARASFEKSVDFYLRCRAETGKKPDEPYAGKFLVRVTPETHRALERLAHLRESTVSEVASEVLNLYVQAEAKADRAAAEGDAALSAKAATSAAAERPRGKRA